MNRTRSTERHAAKRLKEEIAFDAMLYDAHLRRQWAEEQRREGERERISAKRAARRVTLGQ